MVALKNYSRTWKILFVGQHEERHVGDVCVGDHGVEAALGLLDPLAVVRVDGVDDGVALGVVLVPQRLQLGLTAKVPKIQPEEKERKGF